MESLKIVAGDLVFEHDDLIMVSGDEELAQCVRITLVTNRGEWFLDPDLGIDHAAFLDKNPIEEAMREEIRIGLFQEPRIATVENITINQNRSARTQDIAFVATGTNGEVIRQEVGIDAG